MYDFVNNNVTPKNEWERTASAPSNQRVAGWPNAMTLSQEKDIAANKYMNQIVHKMARNHVSPLPEFSRSKKAPTKAEVKGWPYL